MFQLLITVNLKSSVGAGVAISTTVASFTSERLADEAYDKLGRYDIAYGRHGSKVYSERTVEKLYNSTKESK